MTRREITRYEPRRDIEERWPCWTVEDADLRDEVSHLICPALRTVYLNRHLSRDEATEALATVIAHIDLGHIPVVTLTEEQERHAEFLALMRLDRAEDRCVG
jgi:hypothetical protein